MSKLNFGKNFEGGTFIWLDDPIPETNTVVADHYPVAVIHDNDILALRLETQSSLLSDLRNMHPHDVNILRENLGGTEKIKQILSNFKERKVKDKNYEEEILIDF